MTTIGCPSRDDLDHAAETDGRAGLATVKLADTASAVAGEGEVLVRGPQMLLGYLHPEDEAGAFDEDGYFRTGDLGRWQDDDYLVISGRSKDIIIRLGENISPKEVEDILREHPQIADVAIVGVADPRTGERACAVIVAAASFQPGVQDISAFLADRNVATYKFPEDVVLVDSLPKNDTGKILKHQLRATLSQCTTALASETSA